MRVRLGITFPQNELGTDPKTLARFALAVESMGYDHLVMYDHVVGAVHGVDRPIALPAQSYSEKDAFYDPLVAFGYLAGLTSRIELVTGVLILPQRQTVLVARQAADVSLLSGNRLRLGVGIGYNPVEYEALGQDFRTRGRRIDEQIPYLRALWRGEPQTFRGKFDQIQQAAVVPPPAEPIPIWLGGSSEAAFRRAARLGDGFVFGYGLRDTALEGWARVQELLGEEGRSVAGFRAVFNLLPDSPGSETLDSIVAVMPRLAESGVTDVIVPTARHGLHGLNEHLAFMERLHQRTVRMLR